jgi:electron transfer flavoprotein alpha subunit
MSPGVLVSSESENGMFELLTKGREIARSLGATVAALALGKADDASGKRHFEYGAKEILAIPSVDPTAMDTETYSQALFEVMRNDGPDILLMTSTRLGKEVAGRTAQKLQAGCATDAIAISTKGAELIVDRFSLGGNTVSTELIKTKKKVVSVMPRTFEATPEPISGKVTLVDFKPPSPRVQLIERRKKTGETANVESAENLVCVGQGIAKKEDLGMINELCSALKAELGCTRALSSDFHWLSEERMVGISGKRCKPKFHVSIGVSGQIQHTVGIASAKLIVAINKDKEAPIFKIADYGIVGDLYQIVPKLTQRISK